MTETKPAHTRGLIADPVERIVKRDEKRRAILRFLRDETWSNADVLATVAGIGTRQGVHKTLAAMERDELVKRHKMPIAGRVDLTVWGITPHGLGMAMDPSEPYQDRPSFEPSRLSLSRVPHQLDLQKARISAEALGWKEWVRGERLGFKTPIRPDAIALHPNGQARIAFEIERTIKTRKRYQQILADHLSQIQARQWDAVFYLCTDDIAPRVQKIYESIDYVMFDGQRVAIKPEHLSRFKFLNLSNWEKYV